MIHRFIINSPFINRKLTINIINPLYFVHITFNSLKGYPSFSATLDYIIFNINITYNLLFTPRKTICKHMKQ